MKIAAPAWVASVAAVFVPAVAAACPGAAADAHASCCGGSSTTGYILAVGAGLLVGIGSVALERKLRHK
jgi:hypothetical protein